MKRVLVTGAGGFVGARLCGLLIERGHEVRAAARSEKSSLPPGVERCVVGDFGEAPDFSAAVENVEAVVHLAARVHEMADTGSEAAYMRVNARATAGLARASAEAGARRLVFASTIKVHGEGGPGVIYRDDSPLKPQGAYAESKAEAEERLFELAAARKLEVVALRPPLVYGPGVGANFLRLLGLAKSGLPLPLGGVDNLRSLLYVDNFAFALAEAVTSPEAANQPFCLSDGSDFSTPELIRELARAMGRPCRLFPFPPGLLALAARLAGKAGIIERLAGSLAVDGGRFWRTIGKKPPVAPVEALGRTAAWYKEIFFA